MARRTRQRDAIRDVLDAAQRPLSAAEIHDHASLHLTGIGIATVYRTIKALLDAGELVTVALPGDIPRFERAALAHHHHFHCRTCRRVFEVRGCPKNLTRLAPRGFAVDGHEVVLYGALQRMRVMSLAVEQATVMTAWGGSLLAVGIASAIPLATTIALARRPHLVAYWVPRLVFIAAGALLGAAIFHLLPQALAGAAPLRVAALVALGMAMLALLERVVHTLEPPERVDDPHPVHGHASHLMPISIASDALHNVIDGVLIATAFLATPTLGIFTGAAIALHELPRELGTFALCVKGGMSPQRAILVNMATGILAVLGAMAALTVGNHVRAFGVLLIPIAAGNFFYLAFAILWSERVALRSGRLAASATLVAIGMAMTGFLTTA